MLQPGPKPADKDFPQGAYGELQKTLPPSVDRPLELGTTKLATEVEASLHSQPHSQEFHRIAEAARSIRTKF
jgi:hypothetical protein